MVCAGEGGATVPYTYKFAVMTTSDVALCIHPPQYTALPTVTTYSPMQLAVQPSLRAERMLMTAPAMTSTMVLKEGTNQGNACKSANQTPASCAHVASWHTQHTLSPEHQRCGRELAHKVHAAMATSSAASFPCNCSS